MNCIAQFLNSGESRVNRSISTMKSRQLKVSEDRLTISRRNTRSETSLSGIDNSLPIPIDLITEIFSSLPAKSIGRCRCVSKFWASVLRRPDFTEFFLTKSSARPQLLFVCENNNGYVFFSSHQHQLQNPDENPFALVANHVRYLSSANEYYGEIVGHINGFVCLRRTHILKGIVLVSVLGIYNPTTGQSLYLPRMKTRKRNELFSYFGYDPIEKQFKVLSMSSSRGLNDEVCEEYQILTLGTGKLSWRMIECCKPHFPGYRGICINGVLYYLASATMSSKDSMIVCFDFRSEKFSYIEIMETFGKALPCSTKLINCNGKLGLLSSDNDCVDERSRSFELWVLEDAKKQEWSKHIYVLPPLWKDAVTRTKLHFVGMISTKEIVLSLAYQHAPSYILYYNIERKTITRVEIQGMEEFEGNRFHTFLNHVENLKLIHAV